MIQQEQVKRYADLVKCRVKNYCTSAKTYDDVYAEIRVGVLAASKGKEDIFEIDQHVPAFSGRPAHRVMCELVRMGHLTVGPDKWTMSGKGNFSSPTVIAT